MIELDREIAVVAQSHPVAKRLQQLRGAGSIIATAERPGCEKREKAMGNWRANSPSWPGIAQIDAAVRGRIYVSNRTSPPKNGVLANEEGSIYGRSVVLSGSSYLWSSVYRA